LTALEASGVSVRFGGTKALDDVSVTVEPGAVLGLIGPNGAGKTTLFNVVTGLLNPGHGRVVLHGQDVTGLPPARRARLGLARTFQRLELFTSLTVRDNIRVAGDIRNAWGRRRHINIRAEMDRVIELTGLGDIADRDVSDIPTGRARVVEVARALMSQPSVLLLDEPAAGQTEQETEGFGHLLRELATEGLAVCLVEHDMSLVMRVSDVVPVLDYGETLARGTPDEVSQDPAVIAAYLGSAA
jgi:branched-chain amino acid transport system ATP-binding protein